MSTQATEGPGGAGAGRSEASQTPAARPPENPTSVRARLVTGWLLVGLPLAYGVYQTLLRVAKLFTE